MRSSLFHESNPARPLPRGMTIIEILVVLGVIAILMALILPALGAVRRSSRAVTCSSNMRQIGMAHQMYMNVNRDWFVGMGLPHSSVPGDLRDSWLLQLAPYLDGNAALRSPVDLSRYWSVNDGGEYDGLTLEQAMFQVQQNPGATIPNDQVSRWSSYAVNILVTDQFNGMEKLLPNGDVYYLPNGEPYFQKWQRLHLVPNPAMTVHFLMLTPGDGAGNSKFARTDHVDIDGWITAPTEKDTFKLVAKESHMNAHGGRLGSWNAVSNYLFLDGRVETLQFNVVYEDSKRNRFLPIAAAGELKP